MDDHLIWVLRALAVFEVKAEYGAAGLGLWLLFCFFSFAWIASFCGKQAGIGFSLATDPMADPGSNAPQRQHDFDIQKDVHRKIRNDPDYDDWEYGT